MKDLVDPREVVAPSTVSQPYTPRLAVSPTPVIHPGRALNLKDSFTNPMYEVDTAAVVWRDPARNREVPVRVYVPRGVTGPMPVVIFSHGIGESRDSYEYLGRFWAQRGFISVHITHHGTDRDVLAKGWIALYRSTKNPANWRARPLDVSYVIDRLVDRSLDLPLLAGRVDRTKIAVAGHSAGAFTALAVGGMLVDGHSFRDLRVKAVIAMSMPKMHGVVTPAGYGTVEVPVLNMTGTCDGSLIYRTRARDRRDPFVNATAPNQFLVTFDKVNHNVFSDPVSAKNAETHQRIAAIATSFMDAYVVDDPEARDWMTNGGLAGWQKGFVLENK